MSKRIRIVMTSWFYSGWVVLCMGSLGPAPAHAQDAGSPLSGIEASLDMSRQAVESVNSGQLEAGREGALRAFDVALKPASRQRGVVTAASADGTKRPQFANHSRLLERPDVPAPSVDPDRRKGFLAKVAARIPAPAKKLIGVTADKLLLALGGVLVIGTVATGLVMAGQMESVPPMITTLINGVGATVLFLAVVTFFKK